MKVCTICKISKPLSTYKIVPKNKDGYHSKCKKCLAAYNLSINRSKKGLISILFTRQVTNSKLRGHKPPKYTRKEFTEWLDTSTVFVSLYNNWVQSGFNSKLAPSIDRLDDFKGYSFDNIQLITWEDNRRKAHVDHKNGISTHTGKTATKAVLQYTKDKIFIKEFASVSEASRQLGLKTHTGISKTCTGDRKSAGGFYWEFKTCNNN